MESKRCFIAVDLPRMAINEIKRIQKIIKKKNMFVGKFTESENLHLTLKFLGEIDNNKIKEVRKKLREVKFKSFGGRLGRQQVQAKLGEIGVFSKKFVRIIWIELLGEVFELQKEVDDKLKGLFKPENRFMSHITIARVKHVYDKKEFISYLGSVRPQKINFKIDGFVLKSSELFPEGPVYKDIEKYSLES